MIKHYDNSMNLKEEMKEGKVIIDFFATWCGPCKMLGGELEELEKEDTDINIIKVDIDENESLAKEYGVMVVPTIYFYQEGELLARETGFMPKEKMIKMFKNEE